jgi:hypothetical protein
MMRFSTYLKPRPRAKSIGQNQANHIHIYIFIFSRFYKITAMFVTCCTLVGSVPWGSFLAGLCVGLVPVLVGDEGDGVGLAIGELVGVLSADDHRLLLASGVLQLSRFGTGNGVAGLVTARTRSDREERTGRLT